MGGLAKVASGRLHISQASSEVEETHLLKVLQEIFPGKGSRRLNTQVPLRGVPPFGCLFWFSWRRSNGNACLLVGNGPALRRICVKMAFRLGYISHPGS